MIPGPGEHVKQTELVYIADGNKKWHNTLENSLADVYKVKYPVNI